MQTLKKSCSSVVACKGENVNFHIGKISRTMIFFNLFRKLWEIKYQNATWKLFLGHNYFKKILCRLRLRIIFKLFVTSTKFSEIN